MGTPAVAGPSQMWPAKVAQSGHRRQGIRSSGQKRRPTARDNCAWTPRLLSDPIENPIYVGYDHVQKARDEERAERIAALRAGTAQHLAGPD